MHAVFAHQGRVLAGLSALQTQRRGERPTSPSSVVKLLRHDAMADACAALVAASGAGGFHGWDFLIDEVGHATLIEHNPRPISISHLGHLLGDDLCRALASVCGVDRDSVPSRGHECHVALFPDEWQRDPLSPMLNDAFHDAPWDDRTLFTVLLQQNVRLI